jgi:cellulose synthase/poly-beta-1,6-N-acetylglucosamine synthase-like glycosyltransferase
MLHMLNKHSVKLEWIAERPSESKKSALLIPLYNESSNCDLLKRLSYFKEIADAHRNELDVIIIDDGSTDDSLSKIKSFMKGCSGNFFAVSIFPNANKVGALYLTTLSITHRLIVLSDFDTDLVGLDEMGNISDVLEKDQALMGCYFRMLPYEGKGGIFRFQQFEYSLLRGLYRFHKDGTVPVMPGAGSCYKRDVLLSIYKTHSGYRSGEDREATLLGLKMGYRTMYKCNVYSLTRPPLSFKALVRQRIRWNLGYLETFYKEKKYYLQQMTNLTAVGIRTLLDIITVVMLVLLPVGIILSLIISPRLFLILITSAYVISVCWCAYLVRFGSTEVVDYKGKKRYAILGYIFYKTLFEYLGWMGAIIKFVRHSYRKMKF